MTRALALAPLLTLAGACRSGTSEVPSVSPANTAVPSGNATVSAPVEDTDVVAVQDPIPDAPQEDRTSNRGPSPTRPLSATRSPVASSAPLGPLLPRRDRPTAPHRAFAAVFTGDTVLDQKYVQNLAGGNYGAYAAGQAMIGAGQGMAQGGGNAGPAAAMAQFGVGVGVAQAYAQGAQAAFSGVAPGQAAYPPGKAPPPPPVMGAPPPPPPGGPTYHVQFGAEVVQLAGPDAVRGEIARRGADPAKIFLWTDGMPSWSPAIVLYTTAPGAPPGPPPPPPAT